MKSANRCSNVKGIASQCHKNPSIGGRLAAARRSPRYVEFQTRSARTPRIPSALGDGHPQPRRQPALGDVTVRLQLGHVVGDNPLPRGERLGPRLRVGVKRLGAVAFDERVDAGDLQQQHADRVREPHDVLRILVVSGHMRAGTFVDDGIRG